MKKISQELVSKSRTIRLPNPRPGDWLAEHYENGQTFDEFVQSDRNSPDEIHNVIYLQPIGQFKQDQSPSLDLLRENATAYFVMNVDILPTAVSPP
jgi:archaemetzincin